MDEHVAREGSATEKRTCVGLWVVYEVDVGHALFFQRIAPDPRQKLNVPLL